MPRLLVVDDDPHVRELITRMAYRLVGSAVEVLVASDLIEATALIQAKPCEVLLSDFFMTDVDGPDLIRRLRAASPGLRRTFLMTGDSAMVGRSINESDSPVRDKADLPAIVDEAVQAALEGL
jgi:CheY-like chemotaxis protein